MAKKKKKWKSRIKKALKLAAIGGATYLAAKRFGGNRQGTASVNPVGGVDQIAADAAAKAPVTGVVNPNLNKVVAPANVGNTGNTITRTSGIKKSDSGQLIGAGGVDSSGLSRGERARALAANAAKNKAMNYQRGQTFDARPRNLSKPVFNVPGAPIKQYKKGGRVTGIAKRGFGRALRKGKK